MFNFFRNRKYKKMIRVGAERVLEDFAQIINDTIISLEKEGRIKSPLHKEVLKYEGTAILFWFFRWSDVFPEPMQRLTLDEVHQQYFSTLKRNGYNRVQVQTVCDDFNLRNKTYDEFIGNAGDFVQVGTHFARFVSERAKTELDTTEMMIVINLIDQERLKFKEYREAMAA